MSVPREEAVPRDRGEAGLRTRLRRMINLLDRILRRRVDPGAKLKSPISSPPGPIKTRSIIDLAARIGEMAMTCGASAADASAMVMRVVYTFGIMAHVDVTYMSVTISYLHPDDEDPITRMRIVPVLGADYDLLAWLERRVNALCEGETSPEETLKLIKDANRVRPLYRPWVQVVAAAVQGACMAIFLGGSIVDALFAAISNLFVDMAMRRLVRRQASVFFRHVIAGAIPTLVALLIMSMRIHVAPDLWNVSPSLVVASGMVTMLAGMGFVAAAQDALDGFYLTATARAVDVITRTGGLLLGVAGMLWIGVQVGVPAYLMPNYAPPRGSFLMFIVAAVLCTAFAMATWLGPRSSLICGAFGAVGWLAYLGAMGVTHVHALSAGVLAFVVAVLAQALGERVGVPVMALITVGVAPLMPGLTLYRALYPLVVPAGTVVTGDEPGALLLAAAMTALGLALGASLGVQFGRLIAHPTETIRSMAAGRAWTKGSLFGRKSSRSS